MAARKSVLMLLQSGFPPDIRVEKEARTLLSTNRYDVHLLCNAQAGRPLTEDHEGITVHRLKYRTIGGDAGNRFINYPLWFNPVWFFRGLQIVKQVRPRVIHVHDLPLFYLGFLLSRVGSARLIYDLHENYPATFDLWQKGGLLRPIIRNKSLARAYDRWSLRVADGVIVVEPEHIDWIQNNYHIVRDISVVSNTVELDRYLQFVPQTSKIRKGGGKRFVLSYVGQISVERDLDVAIRGIKIVKECLPEVQLLIVGDGPDRNRLENLVNTEQLERWVTFWGWVPFEKTAELIAESTACIIPQGANDLIDNGTPHKLYQYMALSKPVIVSDTKAIARVVTEAKCGMVFRSKDPESFARAVLELFQNPRRFGDNGYQAVLKKFNWNISAKHLLDLYDRVLSSKR